MVVRLLLWNLADSQTSLDELRPQLPPLGERELWISHAATERFGLLSFSGATPALETVRDLIGKDPELAEEFDVED